MTLAEMFLKGQTSLTLMSLWGGAPCPTRIEESYLRSCLRSRCWVVAMTSLFLIGLVCGGVIDLRFLAPLFSLMGWTVPPGWVVCATLGFAVLWGVNQIFEKPPILMKEDGPSVHGQFRFDCLSLSELITDPGRWSEAQLKEAAESHLFRLAREILAKENDGERLFVATDNLRRQFKEAHATFRRFNLVEEKWDKYFQEAEASLVHH